ncbi:hypothetical protein LXL04_016568 [Taraxacum kok-saghyz]
MSHNANVDEELLDMEDDFNEQNEEISPTTIVQSEETSSASSKKRKRKDPFIEGISKAAALLGKELREASTTLSQSLNAEVELQKKTSMVTAEILKILSMNQSDKFKASRKIMREPEAVLTFWNLEGEDRETFVKLITSFGSQTCNRIQLQHNSITTVFNYSRIQLHSSALQQTKQGLSNIILIRCLVHLYSFIYFKNIATTCDKHFYTNKRYNLKCNILEFWPFFNKILVIKIVPKMDIYKNLV